MTKKNTPKNKKSEKIKKKYKPKAPKRDGVLFDTSSKQRAKKKRPDGPKPFSMVAYVELPIREDEKHLYPQGKFKRVEGEFRTAFDMWAWWQRTKGKPKKKKKIEGKVNQDVATFGAEPEQQENNVS